MLIVRVSSYAAGHACSVYGPIGRHCWVLPEFAEQHQKQSTLCECTTAIQVRNNGKVVPRC